MNQASQLVLLVFANRIRAAARTLSNKAIGTASMPLLQQMTTVAGDHDQLKKVVIRTRMSLTGLVADDPEHRITIQDAFSMLNQLINEMEGLGKVEGPLQIPAQQLQVALSFPWVAIFARSAKPCDRLNTIAALTPRRMIAALSGVHQANLNEFRTVYPAAADDVERFLKLMELLKDKENRPTSFLPGATITALQLYEALYAYEQAALAAGTPAPTTGDLLAAPALVAATLGARYCCDQTDFEIQTVPGLKV